MNKQTVLKILRITLTTLWRLALTVAVVAALCIMGMVLVLNMVFAGPSESARDALALTLLESDLTHQIPGKFLGEELEAQINAGATADVGISNPSLIAIETVTQDGNRTETVQGKTYTATVEMYQDPAQCAALWDSIFAAAPSCNTCKFGGVREGILMLADTAEALESAGVPGTAIFPCGQVLMIDGQANEALLAGSSGFAPYCAVGQRADGVVIRITTNGWSSDFPGATYRDLINIMAEYGAVNACILGSSEG